MTQDKRRGAGRRRAGIGIVTLCCLHVLRVEPQKILDMLRCYIKSNYRGEVVPFYAFPAEVRRLLYTTNAIEALNSKLRRATGPGSFWTDEAALKLLFLLFLVLNRSEKEWTMPAREWCMAKAAVRHPLRRALHTDPWPEQDQSPDRHQKFRYCPRPPWRCGSAIRVFHRPPSRSVKTARE